jgi:hypothetical protein
MKEVLLILGIYAAFGILTGLLIVLCNWGIL